jgi:S1-C subfamily serine protease
MAISTVRPVALVAAAFLVMSCTGTADPVASGPAPAATGSYADLVERVSPSTVTVHTGDGVGSGVVFKSDVIVTNEHVVGTAQQVAIRYADGSESAGAVLATDAVADLAVIRTERKNLPVAEFRNDLPRPGDAVLAIGSPLGFENTVTAGIVSGLHREIPASANGGKALIDLMQTDAPISPGNSGGALLDAQGRVVGINEAYIPPSAGAVSLGFAIPAGTAVDVAEKLLANGKVTHPYLGVSLGELTQSIRDRFGIKVDRGALVLDVDQGGPAAAAGIKLGDVIVRLADQDVNRTEDVLAALRKTEVGSRVPVTVVRGDQRQDLEVTVAARAS